MMGPFCLLEELTTAAGVEFECAISIEAFVATCPRLFPENETPNHRYNEKKSKTNHKSKQRLSETYWSDSDRA